MCKPCAAVSITAAVSPRTQKMLLASAGALGLTVGEMIDCLALDLTCEPPQIAAALACGQFMALSSTQPYEQLCAGMLEVVAFFAAAFARGGTGKEAFLALVERRINE